MHVTNRLTFISLNRKWCGDLTFLKVHVNVSQVMCQLCTMLNLKVQFSFQINTLLLYMDLYLNIVTYSHSTFFVKLP